MAGDAHIHGLTLRTMYFLAVNLLIERLKWCPTLWQMREWALRQTLQVRVTNETQKNPSSDWPKWRCTLWRYVTSRLVATKRHFIWSDKRAVYTSLSEHRTSFEAFCRYTKYNDDQYCTSTHLVEEHHSHQHDRQDSRRIPELWKSRLDVSEKLTYHESSNVKLTKLITICY